MRSKSEISYVCLLALALSILFVTDGKNAIAQTPVDAYRGCEEGVKIPPASPPRERIRQVSNVDRLTKRRFASFSLTEVESNANGKNSHSCWHRLDGVWRETGDITLDRTHDNPDLWGSDAPEVVTVANGNYSTVNFLYIAEDDASDERIRISNGLQDIEFVEFRSQDGIPLKDVLKRGGMRKTYQSVRDFPIGNTLVIDVSRSGRIRLKLGKTTFIRPKPGVSKATMSNQIAANDAFLVGYNLENLTASRRGYDIINQDPFYLLQNPKYEVFAKVDPRQYVITEKRTVPIGFSLIQEVTQGTIYRKSAMSSEKQVQNTYAHTFGGSVSGTYEKKIPAGKQVLKKTKVEASAGFRHSQSAMNSMRESKSVAQAIGFSRDKQYALVVDHPYVTLSDDFIDAVEDARRYGNFRSIVEKFGTHYAYAVTYGAAAKMAQAFTEETYTRIVQQETETGVEASVAAEKKLGKTTFAAGASAHYSKKAGKTTGASGTIGNEGATFVAVGGNGSWNESGYSAGQTPYPILLDLRPLYELLNPMNFPGEPETYGSVRDALYQTVEDYIEEQGGTPDTTSLIPVFEPEPDEPLETWAVYVTRVYCTGANDFLIKKVSGKLHAVVQKKNVPEYSRKVDTISLSAPCKNKRKNIGVSYRKMGKKVATLKGTRSEIEQHRLRYEFDWQYVGNLGGKKKLRTNKKTMAGSLTKGLKTGGKAGKQDHTWSFGQKELPKMHIVVRFNRVS
ncbi:MAG: MAC/perforin domain-containing protein [Sneathiella sp.]